MSSILLSLTSVAIIASALVAGVFLTFSDFVMRSLHKSDTTAGVEAMQVINREVFKTLFMVLLLGMAALSPFLIWLAWSGASGTTATWIMSGGALYLIGVFGVTLLGNVPMNMHLDRLDHRTDEAAAYWAGTFYPRWTFFNHVRTFGAAGASVCFLLACLSPAVA